eukprot:TRINITY_DN10640_c0_g1_i8.p2 TRINITY_DN10640_c0_g1~~TRINITY_DN10640_c0_g1_i8.p2  ORF type:complete len:203 (+),score=25.68 TRINITY_DN10640_c0_g1_i8:1372-1980(+)
MPSIRRFIAKAMTTRLLAITSTMLCATHAIAEHSTWVATGRIEATSLRTTRLPTSTRCITASMALRMTCRHNTFRNVSRVALIMGGRDNLIVNNTIDAVGTGAYFQTGGHLGEAIIFGAHHSDCNETDSIWIKFLHRVPYNRPPYTKYPHLADILDDQPCLPKYNSMSYNRYCHLDNNNTFISNPESYLQQYNSTGVDNTPC